MKKQVLRVYDRNERYTNTGECYFLILPDEYNGTQYYSYEEYIFPRLCQIAGMSWQNYTSYILGTADISENEMFWSEVTHNELHECKINFNRVTITGNYELPECLWKRCSR